MGLWQRSHPHRKLGWHKFSSEFHRERIKNPMSSTAAGFEQNQEFEQDETRYCRADSRFASSQWHTALLCNDLSHWLGINLESALYCHWCCFLWKLLSCKFCYTMNFNPLINDTPIPPMDSLLVLSVHQSVTPFIGRISGACRKKYWLNGFVTWYMQFLPAGNKNRGCRWNLHTFCIPVSH